MDEINFESVGKKEADRHNYLLQRYSTHKDRNKQAGLKAWDLVMNCYMKNIDECVKDYDRLYLEHHKLVLQKNSHGIQCHEKCNSNMDPNFRLKKVTNSNELNMVRKYYGCLRPCIETLIEYTDKELSTYDKMIDSSNKYLNKKS